MPKDNGKVHPKAELIALLTTLAAEHEGHGRSETAKGIRDLIADVNSGKRDSAEVRIKGRLKVAKFNGKRKANDVPVETQEFITEV
jgi:hypothetical protein